MPEINRNAPTIVFDEKDIEENKLYAGLSWLWMLSVVFLITKRESPFVQFHARQGILLFIASVLLGWLFMIPFIGQLLGFGYIIIIAIGFVRASSGEAWKAPYLGDVAEKIKL